MVGFVPTPGVLVTFGLVILIMLGVQMLIGYRKITFKGRTHQKVHKWIAWAILGIAVVHATFALIYVGFIRL